MCIRDSSVASTLGSGTTFQVRVPFGLPAAEDTPPEPALAFTGQAKVLVVEDHEGARTVLERMLLDLGCEVVGVASAEQALEAVTEHQDRSPIDVALIDCFLPGMPGTELADALVQRRQESGLKVVLMSADLGRASGGECSPDARLFKPVRRHQLDQLLQRLLGGDVALQTSERADDSALVAALRARSLRVLVAEDNTMNQRVVEALLERAGADVDLVSNGHEALDRLAEASYDLVLMDCHMPFMAGFEATVRIRPGRNLTNDFRVPVLALKGTAHAGDRPK